MHTNELAHPKLSKPANHRTWQTLTNATTWFVTIVWQRRQPLYKTAFPLILRIIVYVCHYSCFLCEHYHSALIDAQKFRVCISWPIGLEPPKGQRSRTISHNSSDMGQSSNRRAGMELGGAIQLIPSLVSGMPMCTIGPGCHGNWWDGVSPGMWYLHCQDLQLARGTYFMDRQEVENYFSHVLADITLLGREINVNNQVEWIKWKHSPFSTNKFSGPYIFNLHIPCSSIVTTQWRCAPSLYVLFRDDMTFISPGCFTLRLPSII